ncbi:MULTISPECIES: 3-deoxy-7-phosphoheptulonate synthase [unclassified Fusibacter]|uniref:3-deoxy-7-phosphoheptulonate synthase n=1 Tax=unclassified Fusibacter TaxID=2624464 RepID=UPI0010124C64|nr:MULTISPECIES: 3-deoxy-7-phosphoheptulonate synthase [unclassified Fusibacter]MCK8058298.1 3-deoxy-7-phosphoheptulonate synthase [Fusibacter sp. A2]NPE20881.1 3-deoxy-7-phosphoheptulonate synthase [Fusibacter sp. A1]RXV63085.1 3-deoxy-7-phosphoheptulonate synthase [Fusibacter sp. A1]
MTIRALNPKEKTQVKINDMIIGGKEPIIFAGPCSVESEEQIFLIAKELKRIGVHFLRGGVFKPRTSPYAFQGLGEEGLVYMSRAAKVFELPIVTEVMQEKDIELVSEHADILQIGSRNMYNYSLLKEVGRLKKPILLKRGMSATINEWVLAAEYIASMGNDQIILCERGIRTFDDYTRNTLDLAAVPIMQAETGLPVIVDPSHGTGIRQLIEPMSKAALACGADGLMIEVHPDPDHALSDGPQSIPLHDFEGLIRRVLNKA